MNTMISFFYWNSNLSILIIDRVTMFYFVRYYMITEFIIIAIFSKVFIKL